MDNFHLYLKRKIKFLQEWKSLFIYDAIPKFSEFDLALRQETLLEDIIHQYTKFVKGQETVEETDE